MAKQSSNVVLFEHRDDVERPEGVRTVWMAVTPEYAQKQLDLYEQFCDKHPTERKNRPVHQSVVERYSKDMRNGQWGRNHQGIAFDKQGILMDGQHRLWAVIESEQTVMMTVTYGLDREAQLTIDSGLKRTTADVAAIAGFEGVKSIHVGIVKAIVRGVSPARQQLTRLEELELLREHWQAVVFAISLFPKSKVLGISRAPVMAALARAFYTQPHDKLRRFAEVLVTGVTAEEREHIIVRLRDWLMVFKGGGGNAALESHAKSSRALQAYLKNERLKTLYAASEDLFPLPVLRKEGEKVRG